MLVARQARPILNPLVDGGFAPMTTAPITPHNLLVGPSGVLCRPAYSHVASDSRARSYLLNFVAFLIKPQPIPPARISARPAPARGRHRRPTGRHRVPPTFTPWRILTLILVGPVVFIGTAAAIYLSGPDGREALSSTIPTGGGQPVVTMNHGPLGGGR